MKTIFLTSVQKKDIINIRKVRKGDIMNTKKRSLALLLVVLYAVTLLTGCSSAEMALYEASLKNAEMLSY